MITATHRRTRHGELDPGDVGFAEFSCEHCPLVKDALDASYEEELTGECDHCCATRCGRENLLADLVVSMREVQVIANRMLRARRAA